MPLDQRGVDRSIAYHGPGLVDQLAREEVEDIALPSFLALPQSGTKVEPDVDPEFDEQLVSFIAKKADLIFKRPNKKFMPEDDAVDEEIPDLYAIVPPLEAYMEVPEDLRRPHFYRAVQPGDIVIGTISSIFEDGMALDLICFDYGKARDLRSLKIPAAVPVREIPQQSRYENVMESFKMGEMIRGVVINVSINPEKIILSLHRDALPRGCGLVILGSIEDQDLPVHYRRLKRLDGASYNEHAQRRLGFSNTSCTSTLSNLLSLRSNRRLSFMRGLHNSDFPPEDYAIPLRKAQSHRWALKSVAEGVSYFKKGMYTDAMLHLNKALQMDNENVEAYVARGALYANNDSYEKALEDFSLALQFNPEHQNAKNYKCETLVVYARSLMDKGEHELALRYFEEALKMNPKLDEVRSSIQRIHIKMEPPRQDSVIKVDEEERHEEDRRIRSERYNTVVKSETEKTTETLRKLLEEERLKRKKRKSRESGDTHEELHVRDRREPQSKYNDDDLDRDDRRNLDLDNRQNVDRPGRHNLERNDQSDLNRDDRRDRGRDSYHDLHRDNRRNLDQDDHHDLDRDDRRNFNRDDHRNWDRDDHRRVNNDPSEDDRDDRHYSNNNHRPQDQRNRSRSRSPPKAGSIDPATLAAMQYRIAEQLHQEQARLAAAEAEIKASREGTVPMEYEAKHDDDDKAYSPGQDISDTVKVEEPPAPSVPSKWRPLSAVQDSETMLQQKPLKPVEKPPVKKGTLKFDGLETLKIRFTNNYATDESSKKPDAKEPVDAGSSVNPSTDDGKTNVSKDSLEKSKGEDKNQQKPTYSKPEVKDRKRPSDSTESKHKGSVKDKYPRKHRSRSSSSSSSSRRTWSSRSSSSSSSSRSRSRSRSRSYSSRSSRSRSSSRGRRSSRERRYHRSRHRSRDRFEGSRFYSHPHSYKSHHRDERGGYRGFRGGRGWRGSYRGRGAYDNKYYPYSSRYKIDRRGDDRREDSYRSRRRRRSSSSSDSDRATSRRKSPGASNRSEKDVKTSEKKPQSSDTKPNNGQATKETDPKKESPHTKPKEVVVDIKNVDPQILQFGKWDSPTQNETNKRGAPGRGSGAPFRGRGAFSRGRGAPPRGRGAPSEGRGVPSRGRGAPRGMGAAYRGFGSPGKAAVDLTQKANETLDDMENFLKLLKQNKKSDTPDNKTSTSKW